MTTTLPEGDKPRLILHVGLPKCGSTSLQSFLGANSERLLELGVTHLPASRTREILDMTEGVYKDGTLAEQIRAVKTPVCVLSSEFLAGAPPETIAAFLAGVPEAVEHVDVVFILRPLVGWLRSYSNQDAKETKQMRTVAKAVEDSTRAKVMVAPPLEDWLQNWLGPSCPLQENTGYTFMPLTADLPLTVRFMESIGVPLVGDGWQDVDAHLNRSVTPEALKIVNSVNSLAVLLRERFGLETVRDDDEIFSLLKTITTNARMWTTAEAVDVARLPTTQAAERLAAKVQARIDSVLEPQWRELINPFLAETP